MKWVKRYGNDPQNPGERAGEHTLSDLGERAGERDPKKGNTQVRDPEHEGSKKKLGDQGKGSLPP